MHYNAASLPLVHFTFKISSYGMSTLIATAGLISPQFWLYWPKHINVEIYVHIIGVTFNLDMNNKNGSLLIN